VSERVVRSAVEAFMAHDLDGILAVADEQIVLRSLLTEAARPLYYGHEGVRDWFSNVFGVFPDWNPVPRPASHDEHGLVVIGLDVTATGAGAVLPWTRCIGWGRGWKLPRSSSSGSSAPSRTPSTP
jgi:hypothetical protein